MLCIPLLSLLVAAPSPPEVTPFDAAAAKQLLHPPPGQSSRRTQQTLIEDTKAYNADCPPEADGSANPKRRCRREYKRILDGFKRLPSSDPAFKDPLEVAEKLHDEATKLLAAAQLRVRDLPDLAKLVEDAKAAQAARLIVHERAANAKADADAAKDAAAKLAATAKARNTPVPSTEAERAENLVKATELVAANAAEAARESDRAVAAADKVVAKANVRVASATTALNAADDAVIAADEGVLTTKKAIESAQKKAEADVAATAAAEQAKDAEPAAPAAVKATKLANDAKTAERDAATRAKFATDTVRAADDALTTARAEAKRAEATDGQDADNKGTTETDAKPGTDEKTDAQKELDKLKAGKLIRWGVTGGVGPAGFVPLQNAKGKGIVPGGSAVTYVMFHPAYWQNAPAQNIYCANNWSGTESETVASRAADDAARERAQPLVEALLTAQKAGVLTTEEVVATACPNRNCEESAPQFIRLAEDVNRGDTDADANKAALTVLVQRYTLSWKIGISAKCVGRMFGFWVGYPLKYTATIPYQSSTDGIKRSRVDVAPLVAFGLGFSPNAYVSLLAGIALGKVNLTPGKDDDDELVASFIFGLGGNLDLLGLLTK